MKPTGKLVVKAKKDSHLTSKERILKTMRGEKVDRIPIYAPFVTGRIINPTGIPVGFQVAYLLMDGVPAFDEWITQDPNYLAIVKLAEEKCETVWTYGFAGLDRRFLLIPREFIKVARVQKKNDSLLINYQIQAPKGDLEYICEKQQGVSTVWDRKPLIEDKKDVIRILSVPWNLEKPDLGDFFRYENKLEEKGGLMYIFVSTPMVCVSQLFPFEKFLMWCVSEKPTIVRLIETAFERIYEQLENLLERGVGSIFHFGGSEQATPPMMSPELYDEFVVTYDRKLFDLVHRYDCYVAVHCHGKVRSILDELIDMKIDLLDPVEAAPGGDIEIGEAKRKVRSKITLVGNIQLHDMEVCTLKEIDKKVKDAICSGGKERFILATTEGPVSRVSRRMRDNYIQLIESGTKYGKFE